jgi:hypothetical protein
MFVWALDREGIEVSCVEIADAVWGAGIGIRESAQARGFTLEVVAAEDVFPDEVERRCGALAEVNDWIATLEPA